MRVLLVDDHPLILSALRHIIHSLDASIQVLTAENPHDTFGLLAIDAEVDLVLLDLNLGQAVNGFAVLADLREYHPALPVVVVSATERLSDMVRVIDMGAMGFVSKCSSSRELSEALALVLSGGVYIPPALLGLARTPGVNLAAAAAAADAAASQQAQRWLAGQGVHTGVSPAVVAPVVPDVVPDGVPAALLPHDPAVLRPMAVREPAVSAAAGAGPGVGVGALAVVDRRHGQPGPDAAPVGCADAAAQGPAQQADRPGAQCFGRNRQGPCGRRAARAGRGLTYPGGAGGQPFDAGLGGSALRGPAGAGLVVLAALTALTALASPTARTTVTVQPDCATT